MIVDYWSHQPPNHELSTAELGLKASSLFGVTMYPRPSDLARLSRDSIKHLATSIRFRYFGTKELRSVPTFTKQQGISKDRCEHVCPAHTLMDYVDRTSGPEYSHADKLYDFQHVFMSMVAHKHTGKFYPVGAQTMSRWLRIVMTRIGVDPKYKGGSVRMAAASAAIDRGSPIDVVLNTGRWKSWTVFNKFYNRARVNAVAPPIGCTSLA